MGHSDTHPQRARNQVRAISTEDSDDIEVVLNDFISPCPSLLPFDKATSDLHTVLGRVGAGGWELVLRGGEHLPFWRVLTLNQLKIDVTETWGILL